jgi:hydrogenase nickel incorporation protein HypB
VALVNTSAGFGGECHLDAVMVRSGLARLPLAELDLLVIENVGNLVCPAEFDVGQDRRAMVYAITEGEEKPLKYPVMFHAVDVVVVNKLDLLPHLDFDLDRFLANVRAVNPTATIIQLSARTGAGTAAWYRWLLDTLPPEARGSDARS